MVLSSNISRKIVANAEKNLRLHMESSESSDDSYAREFSQLIKVLNVIVCPSTERLSDMCGFYKIILLQNLKSFKQPNKYVFLIQNDKPLTTLVKNPPSNELLLAWR